MLRKSALVSVLALSAGFASLAHGEQLAANDPGDRYVPTESTVSESSGRTGHVQLGAAIGGEQTKFKLTGFDNTTSGTRALVDATVSTPLGPNFEIAGGLYLSKSQGDIDTGTISAGRSGMKVGYSGSYDLTEGGLAVAPTFTSGKSRFGLIARLPLWTDGTHKLDFSGAGLPSFGVKSNLTVDGLELGLAYHYLVASGFLLGLEYDGLTSQHYKLKGSGEFPVEESGTYAGRTVLLSSQFVL